MFLHLHVDTSSKETSKTSSSKVDNVPSVDSKKSNAQETKKAPRMNLFPVSGPASNKKEKAFLCCELLLRTQGLLPCQEVAREQSEAEETCKIKENQSEVEDNQCDVKVEVIEKNEPQEVTENDDEKPEPDSTTTKIDSPSIQEVPNIGYFTSQENMQAMLDADGTVFILLILTPLQRTINQLIMM